MSKSGKYVRRVKETVDYTTGEVVKVETDFVVKIKELFVMCIITSGTEWITDVGPLNFTALFMLSEFMRYNTISIDVSKRVKEKLEAKLKVDRRQVTHRLKEMESHNLITRDGHSLIYVNPKHMYIGLTKDISAAQIQYDKLRKELYK